MQKVFFKILFCLLSAQVVAQTTTISSGGEAEGTGGSAAVSVGQVFYQSTVGRSGSVSEGVQQTYEIIIITGTAENNLVLSAEAYPNPVTDILKLSVGRDTRNDNLSFSLTDIKGNTICQGKISEQTTLIPMSEKVNGAYFLSVLKNQKAIKTFRIIKNH
jgi:hypothetical protein